MRTFILALAFCAAAAHAQGQSQWERENVGPEFDAETGSLPAFPQEKTLLEFEVAELRSYRFFVDSATLSVGRDGVVRYVLVARSEGGARNVSYEGLRCDTKQYRRYAIGRADGTWSRVEEQWRPLPAGTGALRWYTALQRDYFCPQAQPIRSREEGVHALENRGHPFAKGLGSLPFGR